MSDIIDTTFIQVQSIDRFMSVFKSIYKLNDHVWVSKTSKQCISFETARYMHNHVESIINWYDKFDNNVFNFDDYNKYARTFYVGYFPSGFVTNFLKAANSSKIVKECKVQYSKKKQKFVAQDERSHIIQFMNQFTLKDFVR